MSTRVTEGRHGYAGASRAVWGAMSGPPRRQMSPTLEVR